MATYYRMLIAGIALGALLFPLIYHRTARWWVTPFGRHLMGYSATVALMAVSAFVRVFLPEVPGQEIIRNVLLSLAAFFVWQRSYVYLWAQARHRQRVKADEKLDTTRD